MVESVSALVSVPLAIVAGTAAGVFALLSWRILRESPFGTGTALLAFAMTMVTAYHVLLLVASPESMLLETFQSATYTTVVALVFVLAGTSRRLQRERAPRGR